MREPQQQQNPRDEDATLVVGGEETTLVAPRFDDEETLVARPVVPLEQGGHAPLPERPGIEVTRPAPVYRSRYAPRRGWPLALVLVSVLIGGVLGGAGLYLYQRQSHDPAVTPSAAQAPAAPAEGQPSATDSEPQAQPTAAPAEPPAQATAPLGEEAPAAAPAREPESVPATERRTQPAEGSPKRGKKGERDEVLERRPTPRPDGNVARAEEREARRVDAIVYRPRRAERRAERRARRGDDVDRLRRIFEGGPQ